MKSYVLALDQGTTSTRAIVFDGDGKIRYSAKREFKQYYPEAGWVEHDPEEIWAGALEVLRQAAAAVGAENIAAIGVTNQRETTVAFDKRTGLPVYNAIVWQCRRTAEYCRKLKADGAGDYIYERTGLVPDAYFSATKMRWIADNVPDARRLLAEDKLAFSTVDGFLIYKLTGGKSFYTDYTNASRTMLFDIHTLAYEQKLLDIFGIPQSALPKVMPSGAFFGYTAKDVVGREIPVLAAVGDQQSALFGQLCTEEGDVKNTYGTGCFLLMNTGKKPVKSANGLLTTLCACRDGKPDYALEGSVFMGGAVVQWLRDELKLISAAEESEGLARSVEDSNGVYLVPAFTGLGAPYWNGGARGIICGLTRGVNRAHIVRAALESIAYQVYDVTCAMERDAGVKIRRLAVDGGASANDFLLEFQAGISGCRVTRPRCVETTALGAAYLAGLNCGIYSDIAALKANSQGGKSFEAQLCDKKRNALISGWRSAVNKTLL